MPFPFFALFLWAGTFAFSQYLAAKQADKGLDNAKAKTLDEIALPTASAARKVPHVFGTQKITSPNLLWFGNYRAVPVTEKVEAGFFNTKKVVTGYDYYLSIQLGLCRGPVALRKIWYGNELLWEGYLDKVGDISTPIGSVVSTGLGQNAVAYKEGGGIIRFYPGTDDQPVDDYLDNFQSPCPAYRDTAYVIFDGYIGHTGSLQGFSFEVQATPNGLGIDEATSEAVYDSGATSDGTLAYSGYTAMKFVLAGKKKLEFMRFRGVCGAGGIQWIDGTTKQINLVRIINASGGAPVASLDSPLYYNVDSFTNWNTGPGSDWIYVYLHGLELDAGTYYIVIAPVPPIVTFDTDSTSDGTEMFRRVNDVWVAQNRNPDMEIHGWEESVGTSVLADANPMNVAYKAFTEYYGYPGTDIDTTNFTDAADTLDSEGNGMGLLLSDQTPISSLLKTVSAQIDGQFYLDPATGKIKVQLIRQDYIVANLLVLDQTNIKRAESFDRSTWAGTTNEMRIQFTNRINDYANAEALAIDRANMQIQGGKIVPKTFSFPGVCDATLANKLAWRELRLVSVPLAVARCSVMPDLWDQIHEGQPVVYSPEGTGIVMRITSIRPGTRDADSISLELAEDIFSGATSLGPIVSSWAQESIALEPFSLEEITDTPYAITRRNTTTDFNRIFSVAGATGKGETSYLLNVDGDDHGEGFITPRGILFADIGPADTTVELTTDLPVTSFPTLTDAQIGIDLLGLILVGDEFMAVRSAVAADYGMTLTVYRGMCDTAQAAHSAAEDVWIVAAGYALSSVGGVAEDTVAVKLLPVRGVTTLPASEVTPTDVTYRNREMRPYPPRNLELNSSPFPASVDVDSGVTADFTRRDYRILDEVSQLDTDAETVDPTFPAADSTEYCCKVYDGVTLLFQTDWQTSPSIAVSKAKLFRYGDGYVTPLTFAVGTRHTNSGTKEAIQDLAHEAAIVSEVSDDTWLGVLDTYQTSYQYTAPEDGTYTVDLESAIDSDVYYKLNGGAWTSCVTAGNTTGTILGVTATDIIEIKHEDSTTTDEELFVSITAPTSDNNAYGVLIFEDQYYLIGGFGMLGFGTGAFGR